MLPGRMPGTNEEETMNQQQGYDAIETASRDELAALQLQRLKWSLSYQKKHGIMTGAAKDLPEALERRIAGDPALARRVEELRKALAG